jgi:asparagine synthase (glutamine-hydrolysing)
MCGILGEWRSGQTSDVEQRFAAGMERLKHRGPNDCGRMLEACAGGTLVLAHMRLSIIDLSSAGHQPMASLDGRYVIVFNGEIYNYRELRAELLASGERFHSNSDTEVLMAAWSRWGSVCLSRLIGMFAFVIYDRQAQTLTAVRDAFGIKPLFYAMDQDGFQFSSEMPALLSIRNKAPQLNRQRAHDYLIYGIQDAAEESFVAGVRHLPPGHLLHLELRAGSAPRAERWWRPSIGEKTIDLAKAAEAVRELFLQSVRLHLRSDVPVGAALSGGIDSSALVCAIRHVEPDLPINTFSFVADDARLTEEPWIDLVNHHVSARSHKVRLQGADLERDLEDLIHAQGEPFCTTSMYAQYCVFREARRQGVTVVLEGQGADELLGGYDGYPGQRMLSLLERRQFGNMKDFAAHWRAWPGRGGRSAWRALVGQLLPSTLYRKAAGFAGIDAAPDWLNLEALQRDGASLRPHRIALARSARGRRLVEVLAHALTDTYLPSLLRYGDRNAMRFSVENRVPFLTIPLAELLLSLPESYLVSPSGETKHVFRAAMRGIVPDAILDRRDKIGFETPMSHWLGHMAPGIREMLRSSTRFKFLDAEAMVTALDASLSGQQGSISQIWRMTNLCWWSRMFQVG